MELRLQSPLSTPGRRRGGGGSGSCSGGGSSSASGGGGDGNSSNDSRDIRSFFLNRPANTTRGQRQRQCETDTDDRNDDMTEVETGGVDDGAADAASPLSQTGGGEGVGIGMGRDSADHGDARGFTTNASTREVRIQYAPPF